MSWPGEEWKVGLPAQALRAIAEVEHRLERLQKERQQKQVQLDTLEAVMHKQRLKHEEEKASWALLSQENRSLAETCEQMERVRQRLAQELQAKDAQLSCLKAQLTQATRCQAEVEEELRRCQVELEKLQSRSDLVLLPPRWGSPAPWAEGGADTKAEPCKGLESGSQKTQGNSAPLGGPCGKEAWQKDAAWGATENGQEGQSLPSELASEAESLKMDNQELRLALAKAEARVQEKEKELWNMQEQLELIRAELAQWKKQHGDQAEAVSLGCKGRRLSEDVGNQRRSREQQKSFVGRELAPSSGSHRSVSSSRLEQLSEKRGTTIKQKGSVTPRGQSTERGREELQALKAEVLTLHRRLDASECQRKTLLETCWQQQRTRTWALERQAPLLGLRAVSWQKKRDNQDNQVGGKVLALDGKQVAKKVESETEKEEVTSAKEEAALEVPEEERETNVPAVEGKTPPLAEGEDLTKDQSLDQGETEGNVEALREDLRALAAGKAEAEAQANLVQSKLQNLQATLGRQTERLAQAMETQSHHVEELLADAEEKECLMKSLHQELEDTKKALDMANAEGQRLRASLEQREKESPRANPTYAMELGMGDGAKPPSLSQEGKAGVGANDLEEGHSLDAKLTEAQLKASLAQLMQENQALQNELACWKARSMERGDDGTPINPRPVCSGNDRETEDADVQKVAEKKEWKNVQTQTEGPEDAHRRRERVSVAFDDTQYEPYGLPEVVMKGFADIPSGPSCPYVLRRGILGSAPIAQLAPRAEPEEDSLEAEEGTGV
ncbi:centromere protein F-like [Sceloporus undulatus]|uniref:centromere protein F-like n=1 Tax=Sceloporus undulatus TaxID=8520 RepID=UPI001C4DD4CE|nr:centromere protein F-like [Sceloporus undulatus]XP_042294898.1 centromere protein F-like [Sceloporus undulatus]